MILNNIFAKNITKKWRSLTQTSKSLIITLVSEKNASFSPKIGKTRRKL
jgi:hypothetical protein